MPAYIYFASQEQHTVSEDDFRRYGKSKENRPNPIVTMGLFMDADGLPLAFDIFPGNQNEQTTLKPLESKILQDFNYSEFIYCSDSGLGSSSNRRFNSLGNRAYIITHSLKKMKKEDREIALNPTQFRRIGSDQFIDIRTLDESDEEVYNTIYYKEVPVVTGDMDEMSRPRQHRHLKRKNSILFLVFLDFPHFFIHSGWQDTLF